MTEGKCYHSTGGGVVRGDLPSPSGGTWVSMVGVGLEPSSGLRVRKKRKETTIIEVNTIYSPELLNGWDLHMARPRQIEKQTETDRKIQKQKTTTHVWLYVSLTHSHQQTNSSH